MCVCVWGVGVGVVVVVVVGGRLGNAYLGYTWKYLGNILENSLGGALLFSRGAADEALRPPRTHLENPRMIPCGISDETRER